MFLKVSQFFGFTKKNYVNAKLVFIIEVEGVIKQAEAGGQAAQTRIGG